LYSIFNILLVKINFGDLLKKDEIEIENKKYWKKQKSR